MLLVKTVKKRTSAAPVVVLFGELDRVIVRRLSSAGPTRAPPVDRVLVWFSAADEVTQHLRGDNVTVVMLTTMLLPDSAGRNILRLSTLSRSLSRSLLLLPALSCSRSPSLCISLCISPCTSLLISLSISLYLSLYRSVFLAVSLSLSLDLSLSLCISLPTVLYLFLYLSLRLCPSLFLSLFNDIK